MWQGDPIRLSRVTNMSATAANEFRVAHGALVAVLLGFAIVMPGLGEMGSSGMANAEDSSPSFVERCKTAIAVIDLPAYGSGSAVCIDRRGYFLTARHVVDSVQPGELIRLVLYAGTPQEKVVS